MKKSFSYLFIGLVAMMLTACDGDLPEKLKNFQVEFTKITENSVDVKVTSTDKEIYFDFDVLTAEEFFKMSREDLEKRLQEAHKNQEWPHLLANNVETWKFNDLEIGTDYVLYIMQVGDGYTIVGDVEYKAFRTAGTRPLVKTTEHFTFKIEDLSPTKATYTIEPKSDQTFYMCELFPKAQFDQYAGQIKGSEADEDLCTTGISTGTYTWLKPNTEYLLFAIVVEKVGDKWIYTHDAEYLAFKTPEVQITNEVSLELPGIVEYYDKFGIFGIKALVNNGSEGVYIYLYENKYLGKLTQDDFCKAINAQSGYLKDEKKGIDPFTTATFTGTANTDGTLTYEGTFDCTNGTRYKLKLTCTKVEDE